MSIYQPFTYLIGWSHLNKFYYGVRYAQGCHPNDLWTKYFTSSKLVKAFRKEHGEPDIIEIRRTFDSADLAREWEHRVLRRMNVIKEDRFLNESNGKSPPSQLGKPKSEEHKRKISEAKKGKKLSKEIKKKISNKLKGKPLSEETKRKMSKTRKGKSHSKEHAIKLSKALNSRKVVCPHCEKEGGLGAMIRWHFDNCRNK